MSRLSAFLALVLALGLAAPAQADSVRMIRGGEPIAAAPGEALIYFRILYPKSRADHYEVVFVRRPTSAEISAAAAPGGADGVVPNLVVAKSERNYAEAAGERTYLLAVRPGNYILAGQSTPFLRAVFPTCLCMGTVSFEARAGTVTDLGYILAARDGQPTDIPELVGLTNPGAIYGGMTPFFDMAVRPYRDGMAVPSGLSGLPRVAADFRAVGKFANPFGMTISRLAPIPGILEYDEDRVVDPKAN